MARKLTRRFPLSKPLCTVAGCPAPNDAAWHSPWCRGIKGHRCFGELTHQHWPKKGMGGHNPASRIVACLCAGMHDAVDNGFKYGNAVIVDGEGRDLYRLWEVTIESPGKTLVERVISDRKSPLILSYPGTEAPLEPLDAAQDAPWPITMEPHGHLKGKALPPPRDAAVSYERPALITEGPITWEQYCELVANLEAIELNLPFWIGDTIIKGEELFGERAYQPWTAKGYKAERLRQYAWVAEQFPPVTRVPSLSFTHHRAVAALPPGEQAEWLERAEAEGMSSRQLCECVTVRREPEGCQHQWKCELCGATK